MIRTTINFHRRIMRGEKPTIYCVIQTDMGARAYSEKELKKIFEIGGFMADGTHTADGTITAGPGLGLLSKQGRVISFGSFERTIQPKKRDVLSSYMSKQLQYASITLDNRDRYFSKLIPKEPFLSKSIDVYVGFEADPFAEHLKLFGGLIKEARIGANLVIEADEKLEGLTDYFWLKRAGRYAHPLNSNDRLPIVYGDLTDGTEGVWTLPCINSTTDVYCYAAHPVLSAAGGNTVTIYEEGMELNPALYTFNESNNYEGLGAIATIDFVTPKANAIITARGKGKVLTGTTLMENIVDQINDFLTVENLFSSAFFEATSKAMAASIFTKQGYKAAGVICEDAPFWEIIQKMIGSFLGSVYLNGNRKLVLEIDDNSLAPFPQSAIIPFSEVDCSEASQKETNLINRCPASYAYDYVQGDAFKSHSDGTSTEDAISLGIFGVQEPAEPYRCYWCRNLTDIEKIQVIVIAKFKNPLWEIVLDDPTLKRSHVDVGDVVVATIDWLYDKSGNQLRNQIWKVVSVAPEFSKAKMKFRAIDSGYFLTKAYLADGTHLAGGEVKAGGERDLTTY